MIPFRSGSKEAKIKYDDRIEEIGKECGLGGAREPAGGWKYLI